MLPIEIPSAQRRHDEPARFCFRYRRHRRHAGAYDVFIELDDIGNRCHIEIHHANEATEERRPFTAGPLNVRHLRDAVNLLGLVDRVVSKDRSRPLPGGLVFAARLKPPYGLAPSVARRLHADKSGSQARKKQNGGGRKSHTPPLRTFQPEHETKVIHTAPRAHTRRRYPIRRIQAASHCLKRGVTHI
ncbi:hypothetical protein SAMN05446935_8316 [Burkholderia sp. YR290]|nr:hypothetical protein SAMN05446935_8316 [Burkholderia sp. YR290]